MLILFSMVPLYIACRHAKDVRSWQFLEAEIGPLTEEGVAEKKQSQKRFWQWYGICVVVLLSGIFFAFAEVMQQHY